jgi:hypothetical protein
MILIFVYYSHLLFWLAQVLLEAMEFFEFELNRLQNDIDLDRTTTNVLTDCFTTSLLLVGGDWHVCMHACLSSWRFGKFCQDYSPSLIFYRLHVVARGFAISQFGICDWVRISTYSREHAYLHTWRGEEEWISLNCLFFFFVWLIGSKGHGKSVICHFLIAVAMLNLYIFINSRCFIIAVVVVVDSAQVSSILEPDHTETIPKCNGGLGMEPRVD